MSAQPSRKRLKRPLNEAERWSRDTFWGMAFIVFGLAPTIGLLLWAFSAMYCGPMHGRCTR